MRRGSVALALALLLAAGCGDDGSEEGARGPRATGDARIGGEVVATVDGMPVTGAEVAAAARATSLDRAEALRRLEDEELLAAEARRLGYADDAAVRRAAERAAVQALLAAEIEAAATPEGIPEAQVRARWEARGDLRRPELRRVTHVLWRLAEDAPADRDAGARADALRAIAALRAAEDVASVAASLRGEREGVEVITEDLPPMARDSAYVEPFREAVFALSAPGVVPAPVRTPFGWHAIAVTEILPPVERTYAQVEAELRRQLAEEERRRRLEAFLSALERRHGVQRNEEAIAAALARDPNEPPDAP